MSNNKNAYGSRKRPFSETINTIRSYYRKVKYIIADAPSFCKDLFSLKCNQFTLRDCAMKNFAIHYIDINSRNAEKIYKEALAKGDADKAKTSEVIAKQKYILSITKNGFGKRTSLYDYRVTNRGGKGIIGIVASSRNGTVAASFPVNEGDEVILSTDKGKVIRCAVREIRIAGRNTQGVRIIKLSGEEKVVSAIKIDDNFI